MRHHITALLLLLTVAVLSTSCIRDELEPCPALTVRLAVKDKNYFNVDLVPQEERRSDTLAFRQYVPTLYWQLRQAETDSVVQEKGVYPVQGEGREEVLTFPQDLPHGRYVMTVWGGLDDLKGLGPKRRVLQMHHQQTQGNDVYTTTDTIDYNALQAEKTLELERVKGKLIILAENLTDSTVYSDKTITGLEKWVSDSLKYYSEQRLRTLTVWHHAGRKVLSKTIVAPSVKAKGSELDVHFYEHVTSDIYNDLHPRELDITMSRNRLTVVRYVYMGEGRFNVYALINDNWESVNSMDIDWHEGEPEEPEPDDDWWWNLGM